MNEVEINEEIQTLDIFRGKAILYIEYFVVAITRICDVISYCILFVVVHLDSL